MYEWVEKGLRGGISTISCREFTAKNHYLNPKIKETDPNQSYILAYNSLLSSIGYKGFRWLNKEEIKKFDVFSYLDDGKKGVFVECDLEYPKDKRMMDLHNDYPLAVQKTSIPYKDLSPYQKNMIEVSGIKYNEKQEKLIGSFLPKKNYVTHFSNLQFYLEKGMKMTKVHRVLEFRQKPWIRDFIMFNTCKRMTYAILQGVK